MAALAVGAASMAALAVGAASVAAFEVGAASVAAFEVGAASVAAFEVGAALRGRPRSEDQRKSAEIESPSWIRRIAWANSSATDRTWNLDEVLPCSGIVLVKVSFEIGLLSRRSTA